MAYQTPVACPNCGRSMRPGGMPAHLRAHGQRTIVPAEDQERIIRLYAKGWPMAAISREVFWSRTSIRAVLLSNGVRVRRQGGNIHPQITVDEQLKRATLYGQGYSLSEVAELCGVHTSTVHDTLVRLGTPRRSRADGNRLRWQRIKSRPAAVVAS